MCDKSLKETEFERNFLFSELQTERSLNSALKLKTAVLERRLVKLEEYNQILDHDYENTLQAVKIMNEIVLALNKLVHESEHDLKTAYEDRDYFRKVALKYADDLTLWENRHPGEKVAEY